MADALVLNLASSDAGARKAALVQMGYAGEGGAADMDYHTEAAKMLNDLNPAVKVAALQALGAMGGYGAVYGDAIANLLKDTDEKAVKMAAIQALGVLGQFGAGHAEELEACLDSQDLDIVTETCIALGSVKALSAAGKVVEKLKSSDVEVVIGACLGLGSMGEETEALGPLLKNQEARVRAAALGAMPVDVAEKHLDTVTKLLEDADVYVRMNATSLIKSMGEKAASQVDAIGKLLESESVGVRVAAAAAIGSLGEKAASVIPSLEKLLADQEEDTSSLMMSIAGVQGRASSVLRKPACAAAAALGAMGTAAAGSAAKLAEGFLSADPEVRIASSMAIGKLGDAGAKFEDQLVYLLEDSQPMVAGAACTALGSIAESTNKPGSAAAAKMSELIKSPFPVVRGASLGGLSKMGEEAVTFLEDYFVKKFDDPVGYVRAQAVYAVVACGELGQMYAADICRLMFNEEVRVRLAAAKALPEMGVRGAAFADEVASLFEDPLPEIRIAGVTAMGAFGDAVLKVYKPYIQSVAQGDPVTAVREAAKEVLMKATSLEE